MYVITHALIQARPCVRACMHEQHRESNAIVTCPCGLVHSSIIVSFLLVSQLVSQSVNQTTNQPVKEDTRV